MSYSQRYNRSNTMLKRARKVIPLGSQTFSKSYQQLPENAAPLYLTRGQGCRVWDVDSNEYVDMIASLLPVLLGHGDPDVNKAITDQLANGISFSLATELEIILAEKLVQLIPCAEQVRFGKNGSDATTGCVRVARAATGRHRLVLCGYHGWHDWYIAKTVRNKGIPDMEAKLSDRVPYNDLEAVHAIFKKYPGEIAALIMEPAGAAEPNAGYLESVKEIVHKNGAILIFDEVVTGFRFANGGAQELYGVTPDLAAFGKAMGNGMPISAVVGRADLMSEMEEIFFSSTFGGEALSLAAAIAVVDKIQREPVVKTLWQRGSALAKTINASIAHHGLEGVISLSGVAPWTLLSFYDHDNTPKEVIKTFFIREMLAQGILMMASNNIMYSLDETSMALVTSAYDQTFSRLAEELRQTNLQERLDCSPIMPVFSVRPQAEKPQNISAMKG